MLKTAEPHLFGELKTKIAIFVVVVVVVFVVVLIFVCIVIFAA